jgi:hypothetical protein
MNDECDGNIDAYSFVFWDKSGKRLVNFQPVVGTGQPVPDIQSGMRAWTRYRGSEADVFTQFTDFNPTVPPGRGFTFEDLKAEIDAGYPVLLYLQDFTTYSRDLGTNMPRANPLIHGMMAYGYYTDDDDGTKWVYYRTSWGSGDDISSQWGPWAWQAGLPVRGVIGYHPKPRITRVTRKKGLVTIQWEGPSSQLYDAANDVTTDLHRYVVERSATLNPPDFVPLNEDAPVVEHSFTTEDSGASSAFFRLRLVGP